MLDESLSKGEMSLRYFKCLSISFFVSIIISCGRTNETADEVNVHLSADPDRLLPYVSTSADATAIERFLFQKLLTWDYQKAELVGELAVSRPKISEYGNGMKLEYEIRPEARWDNGLPITGHDVLFTYKAVLNPKSNTEHRRGYFEFISDVIIDSVNPKKFTVYTKEKYICIEEYSGYWILPEYMYDPLKCLRQYSLTELREKNTKNQIDNDTLLLQFSENFNSQKCSREKEFLKGSGAYYLDEWKTGRKIVLKKKDAWWGRACKDSFVSNYGKLSKIKFRIINDWSTAGTALKGKKVDVVKGIEYKLFDELKSDENINKSYSLHTPTSQQYTYIGFNCTNPKLAELSVRRAIAHAIDKEQFIHTLLYGLAIPTESMVSPDKSYYNRRLNPYIYNIDSAHAILDAAGWKDMDGDGIREKVIGGKTTKLELQYTYNSGNETRKNIGLILKENLKKVGIELTLNSREWVVFLEDLKKHNFEMFCNSWITDPTPEDPKEVWHSSSATSGSNYMNYSDIVTDKLVENIRKELDNNKRNQLYMELQEKIHSQVPCIFLYVPRERIAIHRKYKNAKTFSVRPGFDLGLWSTK